MTTARRLTSQTPPLQPIRASMSSQGPSWSASFQPPQALHSLHSPAELTSRSCPPLSDSKWEPASLTPSSVGDLVWGRESDQGESASSEGPSKGFLVPKRKRPLLLPLTRQPGHQQPPSTRGKPALGPGARRQTAVGRPAHLSVRSRPTCGHAPLSRHRALQIPGISSTVNDLSAPSARPLGCVGLGGRGCQRNQPREERQEVPAAPHLQGGEWAGDPGSHQQPRLNQVGNSQKP